MCFSDHVGAKNEYFECYKMYHGTYKELKMVKPHMSALIGCPAVYGTPYKKWAVLFSVDWNDDDFEVGFQNGLAYIQEMYCGAFERLKKGGFVCTLLDGKFENHPRLGLQGVEFISRTECRVDSCEFISSVWEWLVANEGFNLIYADPKHCTDENEEALHKESPPCR